MRFGIEIEAESNVLPLMDIRDIFLGLGVEMTHGPMKSYRHWNIEIDGTAGFEVQSPILRSPDSIQQILKILEEVSHVTYKCGLHVHVSGDGVITRDAIESYMEANYEKLIQIPNAYREARWCCLRGGYHRYKGIRLVDKHHVEVRIFDSTFDFEQVVSAINYSKQIYEEVSNVLVE